MIKRLKINDILMYQEIAWDRLSILIFARLDCQYSNEIKKFKSSQLRSLANDEK
jgi:hypothetical protein